MKTCKPLIIYFLDFMACGVTVVLLLLMPVHIICGVSYMYLFRLLFQGYFLLWIVLTIYTGWILITEGGMK